MNETIYWLPGSVLYLLKFPEGTSFRIQGATNCDYNIYKDIIVIKNLIGAKMSVAAGQSDKGVITMNSMCDEKL
jgi:hypothetical protein